MATTAKYALRYPVLANPADIPADLGNLAADVDAKMVSYGINIFANRPAAGKAGFRFWATDTSTEYLDDGATWHIIGSNNRIGTYATRPAANTVAVGTKYFATDQVAEYVSDGANWIRITTPAGSVDICLAAAADAGYILLQGQAWPGTSGIYADIYARFGAPGTVPDMRGFAPVGQKAADADFGALLATLGEKTHATTVSEMPNHGHTHGLTLPDHVHSGGAAAPVAAMNTFNVGVVQAQQDTGNPTSHPPINGAINNTGGGIAHNNIQPSKVVNFQAKL